MVFWHQIGFTVFLGIFFSTSHLPIALSHYCPCLVFADLESWDSPTVKLSAGRTTCSTTSIGVQAGTSFSAAPDAARERRSQVAEGEGANTREDRVGEGQGETQNADGVRSGVHGKAHGAGPDAAALSCSKGAGAQDDASPCASAPASSCGDRSGGRRDLRKALKELQLMMGRCTEKRGVDGPGDVSESAAGNVSRGAEASAEPSARGTTSVLEDSRSGSVILSMNSGRMASANGLELGASAHATSRLKFGKEVRVICGCGRSHSSLCVFGLLPRACVLAVMMCMS